MLQICPGCSAGYDVPDTMIAAARPLRCARCGTTWHPGTTAALLAPLQASRAPAASARAAPEHAPAASSSPGQAAPPLPAFPMVPDPAADPAPDPADEPQNAAAAWAEAMAEPIPGTAVPRPSATFLAADTEPSRTDRAFPHSQEEILHPPDVPDTEEFAAEQEAPEHPLPAHTSWLDEAAATPSPFALPKQPVTTNGAASSPAHPLPEPREAQRLRDASPAAFEALHPRDDAHHLPPPSEAPWPGPMARTPTGGHPAGAAFDAYATSPLPSEVMFDEPPPQASALRRAAMALHDKLLLVGWVLSLAVLAGFAATLWISRDAVVAFWPASGQLFSLIEALR